MAITLEKPCFVVVAKDEYGLHVPSVHYNEDEANEVAEAKNGKVYSTNIMIKHLRA